MAPKKYDSFQPKRATNIDGFFAKSQPNRPRQPIFRNPPATPKHPAVTMSDMPKRAIAQSVLSTSSTSDTTAAVSPVPLDFDGRKERNRSRHRGVTEAPIEKSEKRHIPWKKLVKRTGLVLGMLVLLGGLFFGFKFYKNIAKLTGNNNPLSLLGAFKPAHLKNQDGRVNILVAGNSADDTGHNGASLTDSIMVLSVNTRNNTALMLSVPRDLWVNIPGVGHSKINAAYPNGGMDKLQQVIEDNLGLTIDYQALVNYTAFKDLVDAVGGINITIASPDKRGIYDPSLDYTTRNCCALAKYPNGPVTLNGKQALNLARARGDAYGSYGFPASDFDRTNHQRQMLLAIKDKASSASVIANPLKVSSLVDAVGKNVTANLQLNEIQTLYTFMKKVDNSKIDSYNINTLKGDNATMLANYTSPEGQSALIPAAGIDDFSAIQAQITKLLTADPVVKEAADIVVLNGTNTAGLARLQGNKLTAKGMNVVAQGNAAAVQATTTIVDNSLAKKPNTLAALKKLYGATVIVSPTLTATYPSTAFIVVLGTNVVPASTTTTAQ